MLVVCVGACHLLADVVRSGHGHRVLLVLAENHAHDAVGDRGVDEDRLEDDPLHPVLDEVGDVPRPRELGRRLAAAHADRSDLTRLLPKDALGLVRGLVRRLARDRAVGGLAEVANRWRGPSRAYAATAGAPLPVPLGLRH